MKKILLTLFLLGTIININAQCWKTLAAGGHGLGIKTDGTLWAWGGNSSGQLGDGTTTNRSTAVQIGTATNWKTIACGNVHSLAIKTDGTLWTWGQNTNGQLGDASNTNKLVPTQIGVATDWQFVSAGSNHSIAIKTDGTLWTWGLNLYGQLGDGTTVDKNIPAQVGLATIWQSASGGDNFTIVIQSNGTLWGFGKNDFRALGDGTTIHRLAPVQIGLATNWLSVASGQAHSVAVKTDGTLWSWGYCFEGGLGAGATNSVASPSQIGVATNWRAVAANYRHSLATKTDGTLWGFGYNNLSQLGDGTTVNKNTPIQIGVATDWIYPSTGSFRGFAIKTDGTIWAWGSNSGGSLGDGTTVSKSTPVQVITTCVAGAALNFDGVNDYVNCGVNAVLNLTSAITVEAWVNRSSTGTDDCIIGKDNFASNNGYSFWIYANDKFLLRFGNIEFVSTSTISAGTWNHLSATYSAGTVKLYLNGILDRTITGVSNPVTNSNGLYIGTPQDAVGNSAFAFSGSIDEVRLWNVALTQCEINTYKNAEIPTTATGLLTNYHFNQGFAASTNPTETNLTDASGNSITGTLTNFALTGATSNWVAAGGVVSGFTTTLALPVISVTSGSITAGSSFTMVPSGGVSYTYLPGGPIVTPSTTATYTVTGTAATGCTNTAISTVSVQGTALNFDGGNDFVSIGSVIPLNSSYTKEAWVYANAASSNNIISSGSSPFWIMGGRLSAYNNATPVYQDPAAFPLNQWVHVAVTYNASSSLLSLYKNGILVTSGISGAGYPGDAIAIGQYGTTGANYFQGGIDEVRIWNRALCTSEIQNNMNGELPSGQTGLLAYYKMNQGFASTANPTVTTLTDASGNSNNGTLTNFALTGNTSNWVVPGGVITGSTTAVFSSTVSASATTTSVNCNGAATGSATITASGGSPYTYSWSPYGGTTAIATGLAAGTYSVLVTNICGASTTITLSITQPSVPLSGTTVVTNVSCFGGSNGTINLTPNGGTSPYTFNWLPSGPTTEDRTGLTAGNYTVQITDVNGCTGNVNATVTQPASPVSGTTVVTNVACFGGSNGAINLTPNGGTPGYTFNWGSGIATEDRTGLTVGTYTVIITDANGCAGTVNATITQPTALIANAAASSILCIGGISTVSVTATGGTASYTGVGTFTANAGTKTYTITDANSCTTTTSVNISQPAAIVGSQTITLCSGQTVLVGSSTYTAAGIYTDILTAQNTCDSTVTTDLRINNLPTISVNSGAICAGQSFTMVPSGAVTYTFSNGSAIATPTADATYSVSGTDSNGCLSLIDAISSVTVNICTPAAALNFDGADDYVNIPMNSNLQFGTGDFTFESWVNSTSIALQLILGSNGGGQDYWMGIINGHAAVSISGVTACEGVSIVNDGVWHHISGVRQSGSLSIFVDGVLENTISNTSFASPTSDFGIGTFGGSGGYYFEGNIDEVRIWNYARTQCEINTYKDCEIPSSSTGLVANYHFNQGFDAANNPTEINLMDASGNSNTGTLTNFALSGATSNWVAPGGVINGYTTTLAAPVITVNSGAICSGSSFTMVPTGATTYTYSSGTDIVSPTSDATYSISGTAATGCTSLVDAISSVTVNALPVIVSESGDVTVCGDATGTFSLVTSNTDSYLWQYSINNNTPSTINGTYAETGYTTAVMQIPTLESLGWDGYNIECVLTSIDGCTLISTPKLITVNPLPTISVNSGAICAGQSFTMIPSGAVTYSYTSGTDIVTPTADATYSVSGTDANGCMSNVDAISSVTVNALPVLTATTTNTILCTGETATLSVAGATSYTWSTTETTSNIAVTPTVQTTYTVNGLDANGCENSTTIMQDVSLCTGINSSIVNQNSQIGLYPNPNNGLFIVELNAASQVIVTNAIGQVVLTESVEAGKHNLDIQNQSTGIYFVKVIQDGKQHVIKLIKE